jgi:hypothetical protein
MMKRDWIVSALIVATLGWSAMAMAKGSWTLESHEVGILLHSRDISNSDMDMYRGVMTLPYSPQQVMTVLQDVKSYRHITPNLSQIRRLDTQIRDDGSVVSWVYQRLDLSTIDDRDYVIRAESSKKETKLGSEWSIHFRAVTDRGPGPKSSAVRVVRLKGSWFLQPIQGGKATRLTYTRHIELGGSVPNWIARSGVEESVVEAMQNLRRYCKKILGS